MRSRSGTREPGEGMLPQSDVIESYDGVGRASDRRIKFAIARVSRTTLFRVSRIIGSSRFLLWQSVAILLWVGANAAVAITYVREHPHCLRIVDGSATYSHVSRCDALLRPMDPYPFAFLTLVLSVQAAYAAPMILLGQRMAVSRGSIEVSEDRESARQDSATLAYLIDDVARLREHIGGALTRSQFHAELSRYTARERPSSEPDGPHAARGRGRASRADSDGNPRA